MSRDNNRVWFVVMQLADDEQGANINDGYRYSDVFTNREAAGDYMKGKEASDTKFKKLKRVYRSLRDECPEDWKA